MLMFLMIVGFYGKVKISAYVSDDRMVLRQDQNQCLCF